MIQDLRPRAAIPTPPAKGTGLKKHLSTVVNLLKYVVGFGLLAFILRQNWDPKIAEDGKVLSPGISGLLNDTPDWLAFAGLVVIACTCTTIQFLRWYLLVRALDLPFTIPNAFRLGLIGCFYNAFLPGSVGGDLMKAFYIARDTPGKRAAAVATVVADRMVGLFGLLWFSAVFGGGFWLAGDTRIVGNAYLEKIIVGCSAIVGVAVIVWIGLGFLSLELQQRLTVWLQRIPKLGNTFAELWFVLCTYRKRSRAIYSVIAMTAVVHIGFVFMFHLAVRVFPRMPDPASVPEHFVVAPIGYIAQAFFPAPGGVGGGEYIFGYLYTLLGRPDSTGVVGRLTLRVVEWSIGLIGLYFFLRMRGTLPAEPAEKQEPVPPGAT
jgi:uncharacterized protein (TIRG00374 family)